MNQALLAITIPTILTLSRVFMIPFIVWSTLHGYWLTSAILFFVACMTDVLDGLIARIYKQGSFIGALLDAVADRLLLLSMFVSLQFVEVVAFKIPQWFVILVFTKELCIYGGGLGLYYIKKRLDIRPNMSGKLSTLVQALMIFSVLLSYHYNVVPGAVFWHTSLGFCTGILCISFLEYVQAGIAQLRL